MAQITSPFSQQQVDALNYYQEGPHHPFTCPEDGDEKHITFEFQKEHPGEDYHWYIEKQKDIGVIFPEQQFNQTALVATTEGWLCPCCGYKQNWAHDFMADKEAILEQETQLKKVGFKW
jgi:hypothetical protein